MTSMLQEIMSSRPIPEIQAAFPYASRDWTPAAAEELAIEDGLSLTADHWETIAALQEYFARRDRVQVRELHDALEERFHARGGLKYLYRLFPRGPVAQGCGLAGLPTPAGAADSSFGSVQ